MWKRIDNNLYQSLKPKMNDHYVPAFAPAVLVSFIIGISMLIAAAKNNYYSDITFILILTAFAYVVFFAVLTAVFSRKNRAIIERLQSNHAHYHEAMLVNKFENTDLDPVIGDNNQTFYITADIDGRLIKMKCNREVFTQCELGEKIYVIDLLGNEAQNKRTCIAVKSIETPDPWYIREQMDETVEGLYEHARQRMEEDGILIPTKSADEDPVRNSHRMTDDEKAYLLRQERRRILPSILPFMICLVLRIFAFCISQGYIVPEPDVEGGAGFSVMMASSVGRIIGVITILSFFIAFGYLSEILLLIRELKNDSLKCQKVILADINKTSYSVNKTKKYHYYFTCVTNHGKTIVLESELRSRVQKGQTVLAVFFKDKHVKLYPITS